MDHALDVFGLVHARAFVDKGSAVTGVVGWVKRGRTQPQNIEATHSGQAEKLKNWKTG